MDDGLNIFNESGKGYWMEGFGCLRSEGENRPSRPTHVVCHEVRMDDKVNFPVIVAYEKPVIAFKEREGCVGGGKGIMTDTKKSYTLSTFSEAKVCYKSPVLVLNDQGGTVMSTSDKANFLRAQDHGHPPIICLEGNGARPSHQGGGTAKKGRCSL